ncbi:MAG: hypothetical protein OXG55_07535 [bacterium]|nr:hypothetical protein [bacterium]
MAPDLAQARHADPSGPIAGHRAGIVPAGAANDGGATRTGAMPGRYGMGRRLDLPRSHTTTMGLFRDTNTLDRPFARNEIVMATEDLPGVPARTTGKVKVVNGVTWRRYWVFFENGVHLGSLDSHELVRPEDWGHFLAARAEREAAAAAAAAATATGADDDTAAAASADDDSPNARLRAMVPEYLLERSAAARARLSA